MAQTSGINPLVLSKIILWLAAVISASVLLNRKKMKRSLRTAYLAGGVLVFGFGYGLLIRQGMNPNPVQLLRSLFSGLILKNAVVPAIAAMLVILLATVLISNKSICGYGCQFGLLQDLLYRIPAPKWKPPFWLSNSVRITAFAGLIGGLIFGALDWIGIVDPFQIFQFNITLPILLLSAGILAVSVFVYRPWCQFLCPFGLVGWVVEQFSIFRPRIARDACKGCKACVRACPTFAMQDFYDGKTLHADCFACGACIEACKVDGALEWRKP